ncbi:transporter substrate-binding domain-containing protein [Collimonas silvisoli]|uniref:transporter substrate-binding domain-containing protein n=1 Tax=Collimonas silvisoli TaxID=2825884 RepID=UPI001B8B0BB1|nr:transporter substrate-binding domain-containing protein [Collimonas silvisoli]
MKRHLFHAAVVLSLMSASACTLAADASLGPTLQKIKDGKLIAIGHRTGSIPFSFYDENQKVIGYSQDLCQKIIDNVKLKLAQPNLEVRMIPVTSQNRTPLLQNGTIDLECGVTSNLKNRWSQVSFATNFFVASSRILTRKDSGIKDFADLAGKSVVTNAGTTSEQLLRNLNEHRKMNMQIQSAKDYGEAFLILQSGRVAAYVMDDVLLAGARTTAQKPADWILVGTPFGAEPYGFMVRKDDPQFKQLVDATLSDLMKSGEIKKMYAKWFTSPIPPKNVSFNFPMSETVAKLYATPSDKPMD